MPLTWSSLKAEENDLSLEELKDFLPEFEKEPFQLDGEENERFDVIVNSETRVPIQTCSKRYSLVQHTELLEQVERIIEEIDKIGAVADKESITTHVSKNTERLWIECKFPETKFNPGDGNPIELRLHGFNSVDLSIPFEITFGYWRQICSNGMMAMEKGTSFRHRHTPNLDGDVIARIAEDLWNSTFMDAEKYEEFFGQPIEVESEVIQHWIDSTMNNAWGLKTASRIYNIMKTGQDGKCSYPEGGKVRGMKPTELDFEPEMSVPGSNPAENMYDVVNGLVHIRPILKIVLRKCVNFPI